jgi:hypothetical protein
VLLPLALRAIRNVPPFLLVAVPAITALAHRGDAVRRANGLARENLRLNAALLMAAAVVAGLVVALAWMAPAPSLGWRPIGSQAAAAVSTCGEPLYNTYDDGGVLIWFAPSQKVFIDNRQDPYPLPLLQAAHQVEITGDYEGVFSQCGIRCAALPRASPTAQRLATDAGWTLKYADARWILFTRSSPR